MTEPEIESVLADFRAWLREPEGDVPEPVGVAQLVDEFTALRHEVKLLTKATRTQTEQVAAMAGPAPAEDLKPVWLAVFETLDALDRAHAALARAIEPRPTGWLARTFGPAPDERLPAAVQGLALSRQRVLATLKRLGVEPVPAVGRQFDPETMEAVEAVAGPTAGLVMDEVQTGYARNGRVVRYAQVRVAK